MGCPLIAQMFSNAKGPAFCRAFCACNAVFLTIEDETGIANILLWARLFELQRRPVMASRLMLVEGEVQRSKEGVVHLMASRIHDRTADLNRLSQSGPPKQAAPAARHPRDVRILPKSRDFH